MLSQLNHSFKIFLNDPINKDAWTDFELVCLILSKQQGFTFRQNSNSNLSGISFVTSIFDLKLQLDFIDLEKKKALDLQFFDYLNQLLDYKRVLSACLNKKLPDIKIYNMDYFVEKEGQICFQLCNHPLINIKIMTIIKRRCKLVG
jgi:hypothetical protein